MIVFAAIAPHGGLVYEQPDAPTRRGMDELARRFEAARPDAVIVVTPHGTLVDDRFAVVRSGTLSEHVNPFVDAEKLYEGPGEPELADACVRELQEDGLPAVGITFGTTVAGDSNMPIDWGAGIPLWFLRAPAVVVTPCRALSNDEHVRAGAALVRATCRRRVAFVASADHGHGHAADGPYGFAAESKEYDDQVVELIRGNRLGDLVAWDPAFAFAAKADSFWQLLVLHGALAGRFEVELLSYEAPTYFGMACAAFAPRED
ncbi:MAG: extradiol ring-cleavage dioxygenase [Thermoleophilia bacterium]|nr:extradiol ring-cleavage dioxygenase [Thermoleophilia bacterium]